MVSLLLLVKEFNVFSMFNEELNVQSRSFFWLNHQNSDYALQLKVFFILLDRFC